MMGDEATKWFLRHHFRNHGLTVLRYFLKRGFMDTLVKVYNICVTVVVQGHRHQLSIPRVRVASQFRNGQMDEQNELPITAKKRSRNILNYFL